MPNEVIAIACDHGGVDFKEILKSDLEKMGYEAKLIGCCEALFR